MIINCFIPSTRFVKVKINGFSFTWDRNEKKLWDESMTSWVRLSYVTDNEKRQLQEQVKAVYPWDII